MNEETKQPTEAETLFLDFLYAFQEMIRFNTRDRDKAYDEAARRYPLTGMSKERLWQFIESDAILITPAARKAGDAFKAIYVPQNQKLSKSQLQTLDRKTSELNDNEKCCFMIWLYSKYRKFFE